MKVKRLLVVLTGVMMAFTLILALLTVAAMSFAFKVYTGTGTGKYPSSPTAESTGATTPAGTASGGGMVIGSCAYKFSDPFITSVRNQMEATGNSLGATVDIADSQNEQLQQNAQVDTFIANGVAALAINPVDRTAVGPIADKAKAAGIPIVFFNREPDADVMQSYDKVWYVGAKAEESGTMSGTIIADYFKDHPDADKNGDKKIQYVLMQGEPGHQDAELRTEYSQKALADAGLISKAVTNDNYKDPDDCLLAINTAMWDRAQAAELMKSWIASPGLDKIEAILANNDEMAIGAIEALKAEGYNSGDPAKYIPVVGVDATEAALEAMADSSLLGTVLNDAKNQGTATIKIAHIAASGGTVDDTGLGYKITDGKYIWIPYIKVTADNYTAFL